MKAPFTVIALTAASTVWAADVQLDSFITTYSGRYARVYTNSAAQVAGTAATTWSNGTQTQSLPAYAGVQELYTSADWIYLRTTGLGIHTMGPWYMNAAKTQIFDNWPVNTKTLYRIPRHPTIPTTKTLTGDGVTGYFVDGVAMYDSRDAHVWNGSSEQPDGATTGYWNRDAWVNEGLTFDPAAAHQPPTGQYHYHANPIALRYLLGDHVDFDSDTQSYRESTEPVTRHSPILAWVTDGHPLYGPYGFSVATNPASGLRRMVSGYVIRDGKNGTQNLTSTGRTGIPSWAQRLYNVASNAVAGPAVSGTYPLGRYMEDNDYLGDVTNPATGTKYVAGQDFDLDEYNGRWCVTPEFPEGIYAYFVSMSADGTPVFPYNIGRAYHGSPTGSMVSTITETVSTNFVGGADSSIVLSPPTASAGEITLVWTGAEGGTYQVESTGDLKNWSTNQTGIMAVGNGGSYTNKIVGSGELYRVRQTEVADYDPATGSSNNGGGMGGGPGGGGGGPALSAVTPNHASAGTKVTLTITLGANPPPAGLSPTSATLGTLKGTNVTRTNSTTVTATFDIPASTASGTVTVSVVFPGPPGQGDVTFSLVNGFTIQ